VRQGTALRLQAGQTMHTKLSAVLWSVRGPVERVTPDGVVMAHRT